MCAPSKYFDLTCSPMQYDQSFRRRLKTLGSLATHRMHCEESDQTAWMRRLILVFDWRTCSLVGDLMGGIHINRKAFLESHLYIDVYYYMSVFMYVNDIQIKYAKHYENMPIQIY